MSGSPLLCAPSDKANLEAKNGLAQLDYLTHLVVDVGARDLRESHILELHRLAVDGVYPCAGQYRDALKKVQIAGSRHTIPHVSLVPSLVQECADRTNGTRSSMSAVDRAAYILWRLNWIHPFAGGNGRTARAACYLVLCMDLGMMLPGIPSLPTLIYDRRFDYVESLRTADKGAASNELGEPNLAAMSELVRDTVTRQLASAIAALST